MRAAIWYGPREMKMADAPEPAPAAGEVLLKVEAVGICGSELSGYLGQNSLRKPPLIMGHEFSARVAGVAGDVAGFAEGDRVTVNPMIPCNACVMCRNGYENLCMNRSLIGAHRPGSFAEYVAVPAKTLYRLPEEVDSIAGTLIEPLACGLRAIELGHVTPGSSVLISGAGPIGLLVLLAAKRAGASVIVFDMLFEQQSTWAAAEDARAALLQLSKMAGFTQESFEQCLTDQALLDDLNAVREKAAEEFGVNSTPTFIINGERYAGNMSIEQISAVIDSKL